MIHKIVLTDNQEKVAKTQTKNVAEYLQLIIDSELKNVELMVVNNIIHDMGMSEKKVRMGIDLGNYEKKT